MRTYVVRGGGDAYEELVGQVRGAVAEDALRVLEGMRGRPWVEPKERPILPARRRRRKVKRARVFCPALGCKKTAAPAYGHLCFEHRGAELEEPEKKTTSPMEEFAIGLGSQIVRAVNAAQANLDKPAASNGKATNKVA